MSTTIVGKEIAIEVIPQPTLHLEPPDDPVLGELLQQQDMRISSSTTDDGISVLQLFVRNADRLLVLVIDDNPDLVHFYRRYVTGTRFVIETPPPDVPIVQYIAQTQPDAIILDILLPREDGWRLIQHLQGNRATQSIPIIVCSVIRETELAETLGAVDYICKPIRRNEFLAALVRATRSRSLALSEKPGRN